MYDVSPRQGTQLRRTAGTIARAGPRMAQTSGKKSEIHQQQHVADKDKTSDKNNLPECESFESPSARLEFFFEHSAVVETKGSRLSSVTTESASSPSSATFAAFFLLILRFFFFNFFFSSLNRSCSTSSIRAFARASATWVGGQKSLDPANIMVVPPPTKYEYEWRTI